MSNPVGDMILEAMGKTGLSQVQIAARAGMSRSYLNEIISGIREITIHKAIGIERACHVFDARKAMMIQFDAIYERKIHNLNANINPMKPEQLLKALDTQPYGWAMAGIVMTLCVIILAPFIRDSFKGRKSA